MKTSRKVLMLLSNYDPDTHRGIARAAQQCGWQLNVSMLNAFEVPLQWHGDGIICSLDNNKKLERFVTESTLPCVDLSEWRTDLKFARVSINNTEIGKQAAKHFIAFGHRSFAWFCQQPNPVAQARYQSFKSELNRRGLTDPARWTGARTQHPQETAQWLARLPKPVALFAYNDQDAARLLSLCLEAGWRVPDDVAILGVDNNRLICEHQPVPLSSINHDHEQIGYKGAILLDRILNGQEPAEEIQYIHPTGVTLRASSDSLAANDPLVRQTVTYLLEHLREPVGTPEIATFLGISRRTLEIRFQQALGTSIHKKLIELRLKQAKHLLINSTKTVEDIAVLAGFCHAPHLCRVFKKAFNQTPLAYRKAETSPVRCD